MLTENTAVVSSSYTVTEGKPSPWIMESVRAMPDERLLPQTLSYGAVPDRRFSFINPVQLVLSVEAETVIAHSPALQPTARRCANSVASSRPTAGRY